MPLCPIIESKHCYVSARYLAKTSRPSRSQHTLESSNKFVNMIKQEVLTSNYQLELFDVTIKDKAKFDHKHDLVYYVKYPEYQEEYIGEIGRRLHERICDHSGEDSKSKMLKHSLENNHKHFSFEVFSILQNGYTNSKFRQKNIESVDH